MKSKVIKRLAVAAVFAAVAVVGSLVSVPVLGAKCAPIQHIINVVCAIVLGPVYGVSVAFVASLIRNLLGLGTLLAFPGSMCGALMAGLLYYFFKKQPFAYIGEVVGTAIVGGLLAYPVALLFMGNKAAALFTFVVPFAVSTVVGTVIAAVIMEILKKSGVLKRIKSELNS